MHPGSVATLILAAGLGAQGAGIYLLSGMPTALVAVGTEIAAIGLMAVLRCAGVIRAG